MLLRTKVWFLRGAGVEGRAHRPPSFGPCTTVAHVADPRRFLDYRKKFGLQQVDMEPLYFPQSNKVLPLTEFPSPFQTFSCTNKIVL